MGSRAGLVTGRLGLPAGGSLRGHLGFGGGGVRGARCVCRRWTRRGEPRAAVGRTVQAPTPTLSSANQHLKALSSPPGSSLPPSRLWPLPSPYDVILGLGKFKKKEERPCGRRLMPARWRPEVGDKAAAICRQDTICWAPRCRHRPRGRRATLGLVLAQGLPLVALAHLRGTAPSVQGGPARKGPALSGTGSGGADHGPRDAARGTVRARGGGVGGQLPCGREWEPRPSAGAPGPLGGTEASPAGPPGSRRHGPGGGGSSG